MVNKGKFYNYLIIRLKNNKYLYRLMNIYIFEKILVFKVILDVLFIFFLEIFVFKFFILFCVVLWEFLIGENIRENRKIIFKFCL